MHPGSGFAFAVQGHDTLGLQPHPHLPPHRPALPDAAPTTTASYSCRTVSADAHGFQLPQNCRAVVSDAPSVVGPQSFGAQGLALNADAASKTVKSRAYLCGKCGMKKKGHVCGVIVTATQSVKESPIPKFVSTLISKAHKPSPIRPVVRIPVNRPAMKPSQLVHTWRTQNFKWFVPGFQRQYARAPAIFENSNSAMQPDSLLPVRDPQQRANAFPNNFSTSAALKIGRAENLGAQNAFGTSDDLARFGQAGLQAKGFGGGVEGLSQPKLEFEPTTANLWLLRQKYGEALRTDSAANGWSAAQGVGLHDR